MLESARTVTFRDINPQAPVHVLVIPRDHYADLSASDVQTGPGYRYTRPLRTVLDLIESGEVEWNFIRQALTQAVDRGMITRQEIRNAHLTGL